MYNEVNKINNHKNQKGGAVMNSQKELLQFKKTNNASVNRFVFLVLVVSFPFIPIAVVLNMLEFFHFTSGFVNTLIVTSIFFDFIPILLYVFVKKENLFTYYTMFMLSVMVSLLSYQCGAPVWLMYTCAPIISCLYFNKTLTFIVSILDYVSMIISLFFSTHHNFETLYSNRYSSPSDAFLVYAVGLTFEFAIIFIAISYFLKRIDIYLSLQNNLIDEVRKEKERFQIAVESTSDIIIEYDVTQDYFSSSISFFIFDNYHETEDNIIPQFKDYIRNDYKGHSSITRMFQKLMKGQLDSPSEHHLQLVNPDGSHVDFWILYEGRNRYDNKGNLTAVIGRLSDITISKNEQEIQKEKEKKDRVTGLYLFEHMEHDIQLSERILHSHGVLMVNANNYFKILQVYGHVFGELILHNMADTIQSCIPNHAKLCRYEGSLFLVYAEDITKEEMSTIANNIVTVLRKLYIGEGDVKHLHCEVEYQVDTLPFNQLLSQVLQRLTEKLNDTNALQTETAHNENRYHESYEFAPNSTLKEWIEYHDFFNTMFDLIEETKDLKSSLRMVIEQVGKYMQMDRILLFSITADKPSPSLTYQWAQNEQKILTIDAKKLPQIQHKKLSQYFYYNKIIDLEKLLHSKKSQYAKEQIDIILSDVFLGSQLSCPLIAEGKLFGIIIYQKQQKGYYWTDRDKYFIEEATRIINNALNKLNADSASHAKSSFLSNMSHEIRTPMNAIIGMTEIAQRSIEDPAKVQECLAKIDLSSHHLLNLINDILDLSKIESGRMKVNKEPLLISELVNRVDSIIRPQANNKKVDFIIRSNYETNEVITDSLRLSQVLVNILGNALKFTPEHGQVTLAIDELAKTDSTAEIKFSIIDTGIGISEEGKKKIFAAFEQAEDSIVNQYGGTGLGLAISSDFVHLLGGKLEVESEIGKGSTFYFTLQIDIPSISQKQELEVLANETGTEETEFDLSGIHILMAEDNEINAEIAKTMLEMYNAIVSTASNGSEAYDLFCGQPSGTFDLILMDINMPVLNGYDATKKIRSSKHKDAETIPILALTANAFDEDKKDALAAGMNGHVSKPIEMPVLMKKIRKLLSVRNTDA